VKKILILTILILLGSQTITLSQRSDMENELLLIDDFTGELSTLGTQWEGFTDQVMGGVADMNARVETDGTNKVLHLSGNVSLENNGGFIQVRLLFDEKKRPFDAEEYTGIALRVRGKDQGYYVHLRTTRTVFPWSYYGQEFPVSEEWNTVYLPFRVPQDHISHILAAPTCECKLFPEIRIGAPDLDGLQRFSHNQT
jgi:hypothetical protein